MPIKKIGKIFRRIFIIINGVVGFFFLLACLVPYINPDKFWIMGLLGIGFPYLALMLVLFLLFWLIVRPKHALISSIVLLFGIKQFSVFFAFNKHVEFTQKNDSLHIRILDWNIRNLTGVSSTIYKIKKDRATVPPVVKQHNADILCLQEFNSSFRQNNIKAFSDVYPYHYFSRDFYLTRIPGYEAGSIIFSKYPIVDSGKVQFPGILSESLIWADIQTPKKIIRVYTTHLQSFKFDREDYEGLEKIKHTDEDGLPASKGILQKMKRAYQLRGQQADIVRNELNHSPYPALICGDFNDVPNSYTYHRIKKDWQDAFLEKYMGVGRSFTGIAPTLRIDYILPDNNFFIQQFDLVDEVLSDHLLLLADIGIK